MGKAKKMASGAWTGRVGPVVHTSLQVARRAQFELAVMGLFHLYAYLNDNLETIRAVLHFGQSANVQAGGDTATP